MKRKTMFFLVLLILLGLASCAGQKGTEPTENQAGAYFAVFEDLYNLDTALNGNSTYLVLDLTKVRAADTEPLIVLFQAFCDENGFELMLDTIDGLKEKGYIVDLYFAEGFVIVFDDMRSDNETLVTKAMKWRSGTGAIGADYTVKLNKNSWEITSKENNWIS